MTSGSASRAGTAAAIALLLALGASVVLLQRVRDARTPLAAVSADLLYVTSPAAVTRMAVGFDAIIADLYWMRTVQYYGATRLSSQPARTYALLYPLLDVTTSLDPRFTVAYRFGAFFLSDPPPGGAGRPDLAVRLLEKGMRADPLTWEYPYDIGYVHYNQQDYAGAAQWFRRARQVTGSPDWLDPLAAVTLAKGGDLESSRLLFRTILATADQEWLKKGAERRLVQLDAVETLRRLEALVEEYGTRHGRPPATWRQLGADGVLRAVPLDPAGVPYALDGATGTVSLSPESPLWPLPPDIR